MASTQAARSIIYQNVSLFSPQIGTDAGSTHCVTAVNLGDGTRSRLETFDGLFQTIDAVSWGPSRIDLIALGLDSAVHHKAWDRNSWEPWKSLGGVITRRPTPVVNNRGALTVLGVGVTSTMFAAIRNPVNGIWGPWIDLQQGATWITSRVA